MPITISHHHHQHESIESRLQHVLASTPSEYPESPPTGVSKARGWWSTFSKVNETASPGVYNIFLDTPQVQAELLAFGTHAGLHQYAWNIDHADTSSTTTAATAIKKATPGLAVDLCHAAVIFERDSPCKSANLTILTITTSIDSTITTLSDGIIIGSFTGSILFANRLTSNGVVIHIYGDIVVPMGAYTGLTIESWGVCDSVLCTTPVIIPGNTNTTTSDNIPITVSSTTGNLYVIVFMYDNVLMSTVSTVIQVHVGISYISTSMAQQNLIYAKQNILSSLSTSTIKSANTNLYSVYKEYITNEWCQSLSFLHIQEVNEGDDDLYTMLYSANYRYVNVYI